MLLVNRLNQIQNQVNTYLEEIARLQAEVSKLQAHSQEVQTVEQAAESALTQISTALSMLQAVCPDEIATFKAAIDAKFNEPIPQLTAAIDDQTVPTAPTTPQAPAPTPTTDDAVDVTATVVVDTADTTLTTNNGNGHGHNLLTYGDLKKLSKAILTKLATDKGIDASITKKDDLAQALDGLVSESEMEAASGTNGNA